MINGTDRSFSLYTWADVESAGLLQPTSSVYSYSQIEGQLAITPDPTAFAGATGLFASTSCGSAQELATTAAFTIGTAQACNDRDPRLLVIARPYEGGPGAQWTADRTLAGPWEPVTTVTGNVPSVVGETLDVSARLLGDPGVQFYLPAAASAVGTLTVSAPTRAVGDVDTALWLTSSDGITTTERGVRVRGPLADLAAPPAPTEVPHLTFSPPAGVDGPYAWADIAAGADLAVLSVAHYGEGRNVFWTTYAPADAGEVRRGELPSAFEAVRIAADDTSDVALMVVDRIDADDYASAIALGLPSDAVSYNRLVLLPVHSLSFVEQREP
ncbi:MAG: hypothetical protein R2939_10030 [Kofleriaceae bacterium]